MNVSSKKPSQIYEDGYRAFNANLSQVNNPYPAFTDEFYLWDDGWSAAMLVDEISNDTVRRG